MKTLSEFILKSKPEIEGLLFRVVSCRAQKKMTFFILKNVPTNETFQAVYFKKITNVTPESIICVNGKFVVPAVEIKSDDTTLKSLELILSEIKILSKSALLPILVSDLNHDTTVNVGFSTCLDNRVLDLRSHRNNAIFKIKSHMVYTITNYLHSLNFVQIQTPKLTGAASEGGAEVFHTHFFGEPAFLVQSPQLYKQMCVNADFQNVFEIGPVFRAENSKDSRHLCEFTGIDIEIALLGRDYRKAVFPVLWEMLRHTFAELTSKNMDLVKTVDPTFSGCNIPQEPVVINFADAVKLLNNHITTQTASPAQTTTVVKEPDHGFIPNSSISVKTNANNAAVCLLSEFDDFKNEHEVLLGELIYKMYNSDLVIIDKFPTSLRPFYTAVCEETTTPGFDERYSKSYDILFRGQEILSGAQRITDYNELIRSAQRWGVNIENISFYMESFKYGSFPHAGGGFGLERLVARFLKLSNIKSASLFPRAPGRLFP